MATVLHYVQDSNGYWHIKGLHPMGLVKVKGKHQLHFPSTGKTCPECRERMNALRKGLRSTE